MADCVTEVAFCAAVGDYPKFRYAMRDVRRAGEVIAGEMPWTAEGEPKIREAFQIANNWRDAHAFPMRSVRWQLVWFMRDQGIAGITAARLKRMQSIRRKLRRFNLTLNQMQDLGGCRAILPTSADVRSLISAVRERSRHHLRNEDDYINNPKPDGYRSHHLMYAYRGKGDMAVHDDRRIEVQIRTRLQHSWATAVEAVGLFRQEDLKGNQGSPEWLRLFLLMSAEFAFCEGCPEPPGVPPRDQRVREIKDIDKKIRASAMLDNMSLAVRGTDQLTNYSDLKPRYYLIRFNNEKKEVEVERYDLPRGATLQYDNAEELDNCTGNEATNVVLVEADKIENLKDAYPNYFGDVQLFKLQLSNIVKGGNVIEYSVRPQETVRPRPKENPNLSWLKRRIRWT
ncbi:MAG TPA: RelA/SpoT domain-containing protein [Xanthobacteraceae bacterium]|nr:RelA/SpoT domain-containing protein [Xanthobacteraceae bacterium]